MTHEHDAANVENPELVMEMVRSGIYYEQAVAWHDSKYHAPLAERPFLILLTAISGLIIWYAFQAITGLLPLESSVQAVLRQEDIFEKVPRVMALADQYNQTDAALTRFHAEDYVRAREEYQVESIESNFNRVRALSTRKSFDAYRAWIDPSNAEGPIAKYERHTTRTVALESTRFYSSTGLAPDADGYKPDMAEIVFVATTANFNGEQRVQRFSAQLSFTYKEIVVDQETYAVTPMEFYVTDYQVKQLIGLQ